METVYQLNAFRSNIQEVLRKSGTYTTLESDKIALASELSIASKYAHNRKAEQVAGNILSAAAECQSRHTAEFLATPYVGGRIYLSAAFSMQMLVSTTAVITTTAIFPEQIPVNAESRIGRPEVATVLSDYLGRPIAYDRTPVHLRDGDVLYLVMLTGEQLPRNATSLPTSVQMSFRKLVIHE